MQDRLVWNWFNSNLICAEIFQHRIIPPRFKDWTPDVFHVLLLLLNTRIYKVLPDPPGGFTVVPIITGFEVVAWPGIVGRGTWLEYIYSSKTSDARCTSKVMDRVCVIIIIIIITIYFENISFFHAIWLGDTSHELTRLIVGQSPSVYPWTLERVFGDRMPFLVSTSWGLGGWNSTSVTCVHDRDWSRAGGIAFPVLCEKGINWYSWFRLNFWNNRF